jgi:cysteinyl-tRNA synthetase
MITINGQKMARSLGNFITLDELFSGKHFLLDQAYSPMTIRFFILQAHYRSTVDFSNDALKAAEKGLQKLMKAMETLNKLKPVEAAEAAATDISQLKQKCYEAMNDDLNSPVLLSHLFDGVKIINSVNDGTGKLNNADLELLKNLMNVFVTDILGLRDDAELKTDEKLTGGLINMILNLRQDAKDRKEWGVSDKIREELNLLGITIKDRKDGADWEID